MIDGALAQGEIRRAHGAPVKLLLLDQRIVAGLGNIYACEALYRARIDPRKAAGKVSRAKLDALAEAIPAVLERCDPRRRLDA